MYTEDGIEYEGVVVGDVQADEGGHRYATVRFHGFGNEQTAWLADLKPSLGEAARKKQVGRGVMTCIMCCTFSEGLCFKEELVALG